MTPLETKLYVALLAARSIVAATANVNPRAIPVKDRIDAATAAYKAQADREPDARLEYEEAADAAGN